MERWARRLVFMNTHTPSGAALASLNLMPKTSSWVRCTACTYGMQSRCYHLHIAAWGHIITAKPRVVAHCTHHSALGHQLCQHTWPISLPQKPQKAGSGAAASESGEPCRCACRGAVWKGHMAVVMSTALSPMCISQSRVALFSSMRLASLAVRVLTAMSHHIRMQQLFSIHRPTACDC